MTAEWIQEQKRATEDYEETEEAFDRGRHVNEKQPLWQTLKATYVSDEADVCRSAEERIEGGKQRCGSESCCAFLRSQRPLSRLEEAVDGHWQRGETDLKLIASVWSFLQLSGLIPEACACKCITCQDQWSMPCDVVAVFCVRFASQPFDKPVNHWQPISHGCAGAVNLRLIKSEMCLWVTISLIVVGEGVYGCFRENLLGCDWVDRCKIFSLLESAPFHSEWFPSQPITALISSKRA